MLDIKLWLETTNLKVAEERFSRPPALPYIVFIEEVEVRGADCKNNITDRAISVELYSERIDKAAESKIETLINGKGITYKKNRTWVDSEKFFQTVYDFDFTEKL